MNTEIYMCIYGIVINPADKGLLGSRFAVTQFTGHTSRAPLVLSDVINE